MRDASSRSPAWHPETEHSTVRKPPSGLRTLSEQIGYASIIALTIADVSLTTEPRDVHCDDLRMARRSWWCWAVPVRRLSAASSMLADSPSFTIPYQTTAHSLARELSSRKRPCAFPLHSPPNSSHTQRTAAFQSNNSSTAGRAGWLTTADNDALARAIFSQRLHSPSVEKYVRRKKRSLTI